ncbi:DUF1343 domain-containing protein [Thioalkalicoccus limnaeus]|uniref:DUF1343 domain-containing protein n=1 Tax=Thioalkalicoccus limnaeus TaxID=120681 RepID=A0ABV4BBC7_9GAMM
MTRSLADPAPIRLGIDRLLGEADLQRPLRGRRLALLGHPASLTGAGRHSLDALHDGPDLEVFAAFGPQHGMRGDKQDNMIETADYLDPRYRIPVFSLYGEVRYPTAEMLASFDVLLVDLQDIGTRIYTYLTTLTYLLTACAAAGRSLWVLDRPNPAGRPIEGSLLEPGWESFVGAGPLPMRHGLTLGEIARWFVAERRLDLDLRVIEMGGYQPDQPPGWGWPVGELSWINPSPNAATPNMARCFPGTVLLEGTTLSEGRGTTRPLELFGAPDLAIEPLLSRMHSLAPNWLEGASLRPCWFEPTFHKHAGHLCAGLQIHTDNRYYEHHRFRPYRLMALFLKAVRCEHPDYPLWRHFPYEYETERLAIDLLAGGPFLREWIEDAHAAPDDLERRLAPDEARWREITDEFRLYR